MCSIAGWYSYGKARPDVKTLKGLLTCGEARGGKGNMGSHDATGVAWQGPDGKIYILKEATPAKEWIVGVSDGEWAEIANSPRGLLHNRAITKGDASDKNNHPFNLYGWVGVHNGTLTNDGDLFEHFAVKRPAEVDSVAIPLVLSAGKSFEESITQLGVLEGGCTAAAWKIDEPDNMAVWRMGPNYLYLWVVRDKLGEICYWSSASSAAIWMPGVKLGSLTFRYELTMPDNQLIWFSPGKVRTFNIERNPFSLPVTKKEKSYPGLTQPKVLKPSDSSGTPSAAATGGGISSITPTSTGLTRWTNSKWKPKRGFTQVVGYIPESTWHFPDTAADLELSFAWELVDQTVVKPNPLWERVLPRFYLRDKIHAELVDEAKPDAASYREIGTAYGVWRLHGIVAANGTVLVKREFHAAHRMREFMHAIYGKAYNLPVVRDGSKNHDADGLLPLESFSIKEKYSTGLPYHRLGWMCPACGITEHSTMWGMWGYRCAWCDIQSYVPTAKKGV